MLKCYCLPAKQLNVVFCAILMSRILYALPAWGGFLSDELIAEFDALNSTTECTENPKLKNLAVKLTELICSLL